MSVPPHILVVDDEPAVRLLIRMNLERQGMAVAEAPDARQALKQIRQARPDIVLLDLGLPDRDGLALLEDIRLESNVPIIVVTVRADPADELRGLDLGADDYVAKPFSPSELVARIHAVLRRSAAAR